MKTVLFSVVAVIVFLVIGFMGLVYVSQRPVSPEEKQRQQEYAALMATPDCGGDITIEMSKRRYALQRRYVTEIITEDGKSISDINKRCSLELVKNVGGVQFDLLQLGRERSKRNDEHDAAYIKDTKEHMKTSGILKSGVQYFESPATSIYFIPNTDPTNIKGPLLVKCNGRSENKIGFCQVGYEIKGFGFAYEIQQSLSPDEYLKNDIQTRKHLDDIFFSREILTQ